MSAAVLTALQAAAADPYLRDVLVYLHREQPDGTEFAALKETLFLHEAFQVETLRELVAARVLQVRAARYQLTPDARAVLTEHPELLA